MSVWPLVSGVKDVGLRRGALNRNVTPSVSSECKMKTIIADRRWAKKYPELGTGPISAGSSVSADYFELERERIFRRSWLNVGTVWEIPGPGDYFVRELAVCNASFRTSSALDLCGS